MADHVLYAGHVCHAVTSKKEKATKTRNLCLIAAVWETK